MKFNKARKKRPMTSAAQPKSTEIFGKGVSKEVFKQWTLVAFSQGTSCWYPVYQNPEAADTLACSCVGYGYRGDCKHLKQYRAGDSVMPVYFKIKVLEGPSIISEILGTKALSPEHLTMEEIAAIPKTEAFLEKLTGYRFHIEQANEEDIALSLEQEVEFQ